MLYGVGWLQRKIEIPLLHSSDRLTDLNNTVWAVSVKNKEGSTAVFLCCFLYDGETTTCLCFMKQLVSVKILRETQEAERDDSEVLDTCYLSLQLHQQINPDVTFST